MISKRSSLVNCVRMLIFPVILVCVLANLGCGGGMSSTNTAVLAATQLKIGDAPADRVVSLEVGVGPVTMTPSSGSAVIVLSGHSRIELTHLSGTNEPLALLNVPQGSYTSIALTLTNPEVTFLNNLGALVKIEPTMTQVVTVNFSPALQVGTGASVVNIDLSVANSLTFDAQGNVTGVNFSPSSFSIATMPIAAEAQQEAETGELEDTTGTVTNVSGTSFTVSVGQNGVSLTFTTDTNTEFKDGAVLATIMNTVVNVEGRTLPDGTLYAKEVEGIENESGTELEGVLSQVTGNPATQLSVVAQDGSGTGMNDSKVGNVATIDVTGAQYSVDQGNVDTSGIGGLPASPNFPFDATTVHAGQRVEVESSSTMSGTSLVADKVKLRQQGLTGTVSGLSAPTSAGPVQFTLTVAADSAFAMLSGQTTVTVFWQPGTELHGATSVKNGDSVRVRGLVFFSGSNFKLIAKRIG